VVHGLRVLINVLQDMQLRKPLICFTIPGLAMAAAGILMGLEFLQAFAHGGSLQYGLALIMILLVLLGSFLALTGMVLHILSRVMHEFKRELMAQGRQNKEAD